MSLMSLNRREFLTWMAAAAAVPPKPFDSALAQGKVLPPLSWSCPMHPEVVDDQSGACPICKMPLTPVRLELVWSCQLHLDLTRRQPGTCPTCGRQLVKIIKALSFACPVHAKVTQVDPGRCPIDRRTLVAKYALRPHGDHNPKHGGNFIMAPNNWHVEATHPAPSRFRLYVYDEYSRPFIPQGFTGRIVHGDASIPFRRGSGGPFLEASVPQTTLPAAIAVKARFEEQQPEYHFDFQFYDYSKEPK
jgi:Heavy metal binding domain